MATRHFTTALLLGLLAGCGAELEPLDAADIEVEATLGFGGFDFSAGQPTELGDDEGLDGDVANLPPWSAARDRRAGGLELWFRPSLGDTEQRAIVPLGHMDLHEAVALEVDWRVAGNATMDPLEEGRVYLVRCEDGRAAFEVLELDPLEWSAQVRYLFATERKPPPYP